MNKVFIEGWVKDLQTQKNDKFGDEVFFNLKTKKIVGAKNKDTVQYDFVPCHARGKKATNIINNLGEDAKVYLWARMYFDEEGKVSLAIDEIEFL